jgi:hypothetical protein
MQFHRAGHAAKLPHRRAPGRIAVEAAPPRVFFGEREMARQFLVEVVVEPARSNERHGFRPRHPQPRHLVFSDRGARARQLARRAVIASMRDARRAGM